MPEDQEDDGDDAYSDGSLPAGGHSEGYHQDVIPPLIRAEEGGQAAEHTPDQGAVHQVDPSGPHAAQPAGSQDTDSEHDPNVEQVDVDQSGEPNLEGNTMKDSSPDSASSDTDETTTSDSEISEDDESDYGSLSEVSLGEMHRWTYEGR